MSLSGVKKAIYDELYVTNGQTITRIDGSGSTYDDTQVQADLTQVEADILALQTSKMDAFNVPAIANAEQLLKFGNLRCLRQHPDNSILFTTSSSAITLRAPPDSNKQDNLTVTSPLTLVGSTMDFNRNSTTNGIDLGSNVLHAGNIIASQVECNILSGQCVTNLQNTFATVAEVATKEPAFQTTSDLVKTLNLQNATVELGLSSTFENRVQTIESGLNVKQQQLQTTTDLFLLPNFPLGSTTIALSSSFLASLRPAVTGTVDCKTTPITIIADKGRISFSVTQSSTGVHDVTFATPLPDNQYTIATTGSRDCDQIRFLNTMNEGLSPNGFRILTKHRNGTMYDTVFSFVIHH